MKTLLLVDGSSYLYRAFHAMPDLRAPDGRPVGAVYGVISMLRRLEKEVDFHYSACIFDAKGKTFRDDLYPEYKAHRPPMPDDLAIQVTAILEIVQALGWPMLMIDGVEADDVIGTLACQAAQQGLQVIVSTGDKDIAQLVTPQISLVNTMTNEKLDPEGVKQKFGVTPEKIIDYLSLIGDSVDNVPGVTKCGPKTALKWLEHYGSLDAVMQNAGQIGGKIGENLREALAWLPRSRELVTIKCDVDLQQALPEGLEGLERRGKAVEQLGTWFQDLGFRTFYRELVAGTQGELIEVPSVTATNPIPSAPPPSMAPLARHYETILTEAQLTQWLEKLQQAQIVSLDTETDSLDPMQARIVGMSFSITPGYAAYLPLAHCYPGAPEQLDRTNTLARLTPWLEQAEYRKCGQNLKYDAHVFANHGIALSGVVDDTMLASYVLESHERHNMDDLAHRHLHETTQTYESLCGKGVRQITFDQVNLEAAMPYAAEDADITLRLRNYFAPLFTPSLSYVYRDIELPVAEVLFAMERKGVLLDKARLAQQSHELGSQLMALEQQAHKLAGQPFNLNSPKQLQEILFGRLGIPTKGIKKTPGGGFSTDESVLEQLALDYPLPKCLLQYRSLAKLKSTYTDKLPQLIHPETGRVHTHYAQAVAVTGRLASSDPNLQNIPVRTPEGRRVREAFIAAPGCYVVSADYSQIELRIMAHLSDDETMLLAFAQEQDIHRATAAEVFGVSVDEVTSEQRRAAKAINFGLIYGMSAFGLAAQLGISRQAAQHYIDRYFQRYPGVASYMESTREQARTHGYVETVFGRRLYLPEIRSTNAARRAGAERAAINAPMQGTAADLIKLAMLVTFRWLQQTQLQSSLIMQVHDELVLEVPEKELALVKENLPRLMASVAQLNVPLLVEVGSGLSWEAAH